jgi:hypothetical protein
MAWGAWFANRTTPQAAFYRETHSLVNLNLYAAKKRLRPWRSFGCTASCVLALASSPSRTHLFRLQTQSRRIRKFVSARRRNQHARPMRYPINCVLGPWPWSRTRPCCWVWPGSRTRPRRNRRSSRRCQCWTRRRRRSWSRTDSYGCSGSRSSRCCCSRRSGCSCRRRRCRGKRGFGVGGGVVSGYNSLQGPKSYTSTRATPVVLFTPRTIAV